MHRQTYTLATLALSTFCKNDRVANSLHERLCTFFALTPVHAQSGTHEIRFIFQHSADAIQRPLDALLIEHTSRLVQWRTPTGLLIECGRSALQVDITRGRGVGNLHEEFWDLPLGEQRQFFLAGLLCLWRQQQYHGLHANGVVVDNQGILICGAPGTGKTTLTLSLLRAGGQFLADDCILLHNTDAGVDALAVRRGVSCRMDTIDRIPELKARQESWPDLGDGRKLTRTDTIGSNRSIDHCIPGLLLFPQIHHRVHSELEPLTETDALALLFQQSVGYLRDRTMVHEFLQVVQGLAQQARAFRFHCGQDIFHTPRAVAQQIAALFD